MPPGPLLTISKGKPEAQAIPIKKALALEGLKRKVLSSRIGFGFAGLCYSSVVPVQ